jgi:hypothetical protein
MLARQVLYQLNHAYNPFCFSDISGWVLRLFAQTNLDHDPDPPTYASCIARMTGVHRHTQLFLLTWVSLTFCLGWPEAVILLISAS